jgi:hypothetical protein
MEEITMSQVKVKSHQLNLIPRIIGQISGTGYRPSWPNQRRISLENLEDEDFRLVIVYTLIDIACTIVWFS